MTRDSYKNIKYTDPQTLNLYEYCDDNPVSNTDPSGNDTQSTILAINVGCSAVAGGLGVVAAFCPAATPVALMALGTVNLGVSAFNGLEYLAGNESAKECGTYIAGSFVSDVGGIGGFFLGEFGYQMAASSAAAVGVGTDYVASSLDSSGK